MKQITSVDHEVLKQFLPQEVEFLKHRLNDPILQKFFKAQAEAAAKQLSSLNPINYEEAKATEYLREATGYKLMEFFWANLLDFSVTFARSIKQQ